MRPSSLATLCVALGSASADAVTMDWVYVGNRANPADTEVMIDGTTGYGSVP